MVLWVAFPALLFPLTGRSTAKPMLAMPALASLGALIAFFVQGKGWLEHCYPALALFSLTAGAALQMRARDGLGLAMAAAIAGATLAGSLSVRHGPASRRDRADAASPGSRRRPRRPGAGSSAR